MPLMIVFDLFYRAPLGCDRYMMEDYGKIISYNFRRTATGTSGAILTNSNSGIELALQRYANIYIFQVYMFISTINIIYILQRQRAGVI